MNKTIISCLGTGFLAASLPAVDFPHAESSDDMASAAAWGGSLPSATDQVTFNRVGAEENVVASSDVTFGLLFNGHRNGYNEKLIFDMRSYDPVRKLSFQGYLGGDGGHKHVYFKGGYWDFGGKNIYVGKAGYCGDNRLAAISDGAVITNSGHLVMGYTAQDRLRCELSGQSRLYVENFKFTDNKTARGNENWLKVTGGSEMQIAGEIVWESGVGSWANAVKNQPDGDMFYKDYLVVSGSGSELLVPTTKSSVWHCLGAQGGSATIVEDGANLKIDGKVCLWGQYTRHNLFRVDNATAYLGAAYGGYAISAGGDRSNRVEVVNGATLKTGAFHFGYNNGSVGCPGNTLVISNATLEVTEFNFGDHLNSSNQYALIQGPRATLIPGANFTLFTGMNSEYCIELGAVFRPPANFALYTGGRRDERLRVRNGGVLAFAGLGTACQQKTDEVTAWNNRIIADAGGIVSGQYVNVQGESCTFEITDASVVLTNYPSYSVTVGFTDGYGGLGTNCLMSIAGSRPSVYLQNPLIVKNSSRLLFKLPANGYEDGVKPLVCDDKIDMQAGCALEVTGAAEMHANLLAAGVHGEYVLAENPSSKGFFTDEQVAAATATMPEGVKLRKRVKDGKNQLVVKAGMPYGLMMLVR